MEKKDDSDLAHEAFVDLFDKDSNYHFSVEYGGLKEYNAQVIKVYNTIKFKLSNRWREISPMIKKGLFESLLVKLFKRSMSFKAKRTTSLEVYLNFVKNLELSSKKKFADPNLVESFNRVNKTYFNNSLDQPNLRFGREAFVKLASYNFHNDTVVVSSIFKDAPLELIDLLMYHELLHKKLKFSGVLSRKFHTTKFRNLERQFLNYDEVEKKLTDFVRREYNRRNHRHFGFV